MNLARLFVVLVQFVPVNQLPTTHKVDVQITPGQSVVRVPFYLAVDPTMILLRYFGLVVLSVL